jgi:hypothetical protein
MNCYLIFAILSLCGLSSAAQETNHWFGSVKMNIAKEVTYKAYSDQALVDGFKTEAAAWLHDELTYVLI